MSSGRNDVSSSEELIEYMRSKRGFVSRGQMMAAKMDWKYAASYDELVTRAQLFTDDLQKDARVDRPTRELIILAAAATRLFQEGVRLHIDVALRLGVSPETIADAMQPLIITSGAPSFFLVMNELDRALEAAGSSDGTSG